MADDNRPHPSRRGGVVVALWQMQGLSNSGDVV